MPSSSKDRKDPVGPANRVRFERHASQVVFDPDSSSYVVTWAKCGIAEDERLRLRKDANGWIPSVSAMAELYDRGVVSGDRVVPAALAISAAYGSGDRVGLDTETSRRAAELVGEIARMGSDSSSPSDSADLGHAIRGLIDEMAEVRFRNSSMDDFSEDSLSALEKAAEECMSVPDFTEWPPKSMRRRFLYCLKNRNRTPLSYTMASLIFDCGTCPLLTSQDRRALRMQSLKASAMEAGMFSKESIASFFAHALGVMRDAKSEGKTSLGIRMTQQEFADSVLVGGTVPADSGKSKKGTETNE